jgi:hypothetical protein
VERKTGRRSGASIVVFAPPESNAAFDEGKEEITGK